MGIPIIDRTRRNHALEHATVAVLLERGAQGPLAGNATPDGFFLYGALETEEVDSAVSEALMRLQEGESELAISPYCGTNLVVGALIAGLISGIIMRRSKSRFRSLPASIVGIVAATWLRRPVGGMIQRHYTTLARAEGLRIRSIGRFNLGRFTVHLVRTTLASG